MADDTYTLEAEVLEALPNAMFRVRLMEQDKEVIVHTAGKIRRPRYRILLGDKVAVAFSPYDNDLANGRIKKDWSSAWQGVNQVFRKQNRA